MKAFFKKYKHGLFFLYMFIYFPWFSYLEKKVTTDFHEIYMPIDDCIPFCEFFIVPYLLWFAYVIVVVAGLFIKDSGEFTRLCIFLGVGMTVFLIISTIYPNGHYLRPDTFPRNNIFTELTQMIYNTDTPTNLFPSIHVYNSLAVFLAVRHSKHVKRMRTRIISLILMMSIVLSTVFLKQHSMFDVLTAVILAGVMWMFLYSPIAIRPFTKKEAEAATAE